MYFKYIQVKNEGNKYKASHTCKLLKTYDVLRVDTIFNTKL